MTAQRVAIVTGAATGIGQAVARHLLATGYAVVGCGRSACAWSADGFTFVEADVSRDEDVRRVLRQARETPGALYAVVNCAATASMNAALLTPSDSVADMLLSNVVGTFAISREAAKAMRRTGGRIVNFSSVAVPLRLEGQAAYVAAKAGVERLSQVMAREFADFGVTVNVIGAAPTDTRLTRGVPAATMQRLLDRLPLGRMGTFEDVTHVVDFFLDPRSAAVTGQVLYLGGVSGG